MYHVSAQGVDEHMINVHYYYYIRLKCIWQNKTKWLKITICYLVQCQLKNRSRKHAPQKSSKIYPKVYDGRVEEK